MLQEKALRDETGGQRLGSTYVSNHNFATRVTIFSFFFSVGFARTEMKTVGL
jgi:hypothetical protein